MTEKIKSVLVNGWETKSENIVESSPCDLHFSSSSISEMKEMGLSKCGIVIFKSSQSTLKPAWMTWSSSLLASPVITQWEFDNWCLEHLWDFTCPFDLDHEISDQRPYFFEKKRDCYKDPASACL